MPVIGAVSIHTLRRPLRADEDLEDVVEVDLGVLAEVQAERAGEGVDEEVKELLLVNFAVCLLVWSHTVSKQTTQLTGFARY